MAVEKLSVSLPRTMVEEIRSEARERGISVSAWLGEAAREHLKTTDGLRGVAEYEAEFGAFTDEELAAADAELEALGVISPRR